MLSAALPRLGKFPTLRYRYAAPLPRASTTEIAETGIHLKNNRVLDVLENMLA